MKAASYAQRLFDRAGPVEPGGAATPTGPSASPLANADQRLNEPGFAGLFNLIDAPAEPAADGQSDEPPSRSVAPPLRCDADLVRRPSPRPARGEVEPPPPPIASAAPRAPPADAPGPPRVGRISAEDFTSADASPVEERSSPPEPAIGTVLAEPRPKPEPEQLAARPRRGRAGRASSFPGQPAGPSCHPVAAKSHTFAAAAPGGGRPGPNGRRRARFRRRSGRGVGQS